MTALRNPIVAWKHVDVRKAICMAEELLRRTHELVGNNTCPSILQSYFLAIHCIRKAERRSICYEFKDDVFRGGARAPRYIKL